MRRNKFRTRSESIPGKPSEKYNKLKMNKFFNLKKFKKLKNYLAIGALVGITGVTAAFYPFHTARIIGSKPAFALQRPATVEIAKTQKAEAYKLNVKDVKYVKADTIPKTQELQDKKNEEFDEYNKFDDVYEFDEYNEYEEFDEFEKFPGAKEFGIAVILNAIIGILVIIGYGEKGKHKNKNKRKLEKN